VDIDEFKISNSQKKVIKKFHNYLNYGNVHGPEIEDAKDSDANMEDQAADQDKEIEDPTRANTKKVIIEELKVLLQDIYLYKHVFPNLDFGEMGDVDLKQKYEDKHAITYNYKMQCLQSNILMIDKARDFTGNLEEELKGTEY
jgi:hypothetical protein